MPFPPSAYGEINGISDGQYGGRSPSYGFNHGKHIWDIIASRTSKTQTINYIIVILNNKVSQAELKQR